MSLLNFPPEITLQFIRKINLIKRHQLALTHSSLVPLCFDRTLDRKPRGTIALNELHKWFVHSRTEEEREICFSANVFNRLCVNNFKEVVHLFMDPNRNEIFVNNPKILQFFKGIIVLEGEGEDFCAEFYRIFLLLLARVKGKLLVAFVNIQSFENLNLEHYMELISSKWGYERGDEYSFIAYNCDHSSMSVFRLMENSIWSYHHFNFSEEEKYHEMNIEKRITCVEETKFVIKMINKEYFLSQCVPVLESFLPTLERYQYAAHGPDGILKYCNNCEAVITVFENYVYITILEPARSLCADCAVKWNA